MPARTFVDRAVLPAGHARRHAPFTQGADEVSRVVRFVSSRRNPTASFPWSTRATLIEPHRASPRHSTTANIVVISTGSPGWRFEPAGRVPLHAVIAEPLL